MTSIENIKIEHTKETDKSPGEMLDTNQLEANFNDLFFEDLENGNIKIKRQNNLYIFEQKDKNGYRIDDAGDQIKKFCVKDKILKDFLEKKKTNEEIDLKHKILLNKFFETININKDLSGFQTEIISESVDMLDINNLINEYKKYLTYKNSDIRNNSRDGRSTLRELQKESEYRIKILEGIKADLGKSNNIDIYLRDINICKDDITDFEYAKQKALLGENANVPRLLHDKKSIDKYNIELKNQTILAEKINKVLKNIAANKLFLNDQEGLREYLYAVYHGEIDSSTHPFYAKHQADFVILKAMDENLYRDIMKKRPKTKRIKPGTYYIENSKIVRCTGNNVSGSKSSGFEKGGELFSDALVKLGIIDENDKTKQAAWAKFGKVGILALGAFALYKIFTTKGKGRWGWIGGTLGGLLALNNADKIQNWFKDAFGKKDAKTNEIVDKMNMDKNPEIIEEYITPQAATLRCIGGIPIKTLVSDGIIVEKSGKMQLDYKQYEKSVVATSKNQKEKKDNISAMLEIKNNPDKDALHKSLEYMGINDIKSFESLSLNDPKRTLLDTPNVSNYFERLSSPINAELAKEGFKPTNAKSWYEMTNEYSGSKPSNQEIIERIRKGYLNFDKNKNYTLNKMMNNTEIDLENKTIKGFKNSAGNLIKFKTYEEMFDAMQLTDFIKDNFKGKTTVSENNEPFHINTLGNIEFDNTNWYEVWKNETNVVNANFYKNTLNNVSPTLGQQKEDYVKYLNERWKTEGKVSS